MSATEPDVAALLDEQKRYYDLRAPDFGDASVPDRNVFGDMAPELVGPALDRLAPSGDVLELACGSGSFTRHLVGRAASLTAVDASPAMLARNRAEVGDDRVTYVEADLFRWQPDRTYDTAFFGFWLSHVPPPELAAFFTTLQAALRPGGRALFVDEDDRCAERPDAHGTDALPAVTRRLRDGRTFDIVKVFWDPDDLVIRLAELGWTFDIQRLGETFMTGAGTPPA